MSFILNFSWNTNISHSSSKEQVTVKHLFPGWLCHSNAKSCVPRLSTLPCLYLTDTTHSSLGRTITRAWQSCGCTQDSVGSATALFTNHATVLTGRWKLSFGGVIPNEPYGIITISSKSQISSHFNDRQRENWKEWRHTRLYKEHTTALCIFLETRPVFWGGHLLCF